MDPLAPSSPGSDPGLGSSEGFGSPDAPSLRREFFWMALAMSVSVGFAVFLLATWRRRSDAGGVGVAGAFAAPGPAYYPQLGTAPTPVPPPSATASNATRAVNFQTVLRTITVGPGDPPVLFEAVGDRVWFIQLRNVGPAGSFALAATDPGSIRGTGNVPVGDGVVIPAGGHTDLKLLPRQRIYVRGDVPGVTITLTGAIV